MWSCTALVWAKVVKNVAHSVSLTVFPCPSVCSKDLLSVITLHVKKYYSKHYAVNFLKDPARSLQQVI